MPEQSNARGSCLCGTVSISVESLPERVGACHCSMCQKWTGGPLFAVECRQGVRFEGQESISIFTSSEWAERGFCNRCGSHLFYRLKETGEYALPPGLFNDTSSLNFDYQVFIDEKPAFYDFANETKNMTGAEVFAMYSGKTE